MNNRATATGAGVVAAGLEVVLLTISYTSGQDIPGEYRAALHAFFVPLALYLLPDDFPRLRKRA